MPGAGVRTPSLGTPNQPSPQGGGLRTGVSVGGMDDCYRAATTTNISDLVGAAFQPRRATVVAGAFRA